MIDNYNKTCLILNIFRNEGSDENREAPSAYVRLFNNILNLDLFQIKSNLDLFSSEYHQSDDQEKLRMKLKKSLLEEILKSDVDDRDFYETCLKETVDMTMLRSRRESGYPCCLAGCNYISGRHRNYIMHIKRAHPNAKSVLCNYKKKCQRNFSSVEALVTHVNRDHSPEVDQSVIVPPVAPINVSCKCNRRSCGGMVFSNTKGLMGHYNSFHASEERDCIFLGCKTDFHASNPKTAMNHFRIYHKTTGKMDLKVRHLTGSAQASSSSNLAEEVNVVEERNVSEDIFAGDVFDEPDQDDLGDLAQQEDFVGDELESSQENYYLQYYSDFLNRLAHFKFIPQSTIQDICEEYILNTKKSLKMREKALVKSLKDRTDLSNTDIDKIVSDVMENDEVLNAQIKLNTEYKRLKFVQESPSYVGPIEILLNKSEVQAGMKKDVLHYVPIVDSFKTLVQDTSFNKMVSMKKRRNDTKVRDMKDGTVFHNSEYFQSNPEAFAALLYSDAVELKNPLGAARGVYKIVQVFYTLCEIDKSQRSKIDRIQLVCVFREKLLKKYSYKTIYKMLVEDLLKLEAGVVVNFPVTRRIKCGVLCYSADNLEASTVGGFSACFSSKDVCRVCHIQHHDLETDIQDRHGKLYELWTAEEYDRITSTLEEPEIEDVEEIVQVVPENLFTEISGQSDEEDECDSEEVDSDDNEAVEVVVNKRGLKSVCPLNILRSFHCVNGFPLGTPSK